MALIWSIAVHTVRNKSYSGDMCYEYHSAYDIFDMCYHTSRTVTYVKCKVHVPKQTRKFMCNGDC